MAKSKIRIIKLPPSDTKSIQQWRFIEAISLFSSQLAMAATEFNDRIQFIKTGKEIIRGNDGVALGIRQHNHGPQAKSSNAR